MHKIPQPAGWMIVVAYLAMTPVCQADSLASLAEAQLASAPVPPGVASREQGDEAGALLAEAKSLYGAGKFASAEQRARQYLAQVPASAAAMYLLGHSYQHENKPKDSLEWFTKAAALVPPTAEDLRTVGLDYVLLDDYADAIHWLERAVAEDPKDAEAWYALGRARMMQGNTAEAEKALMLSLRLEPRLVKAENNLGVLYETEDRPDDAINAYKTAIAWQHESPRPSEQPLLNLGTLLITRQQGKDAVPLLEQAVKIAPGSVKAHEQLARALDQAGDLVAALPQMQAAIHLEEKNPRLHFELGQMYRRAGMAKESAEELKLSRQLYGSHSTSPDE